MLGLQKESNKYTKDELNDLSKKGMLFSSFKHQNLSLLDSSEKEVAIVSGNPRF
jgi:hypothetical protein